MNYFDRIHPRNIAVTTQPTFRCPKCREFHLVEGSKQKWNAILKRFKRYCAPCYNKLQEEKING